MAMDGYFASDSMLRRVQGERVLMIAGPRALLMQAAHPLAVEGSLAHTTELGVNAYAEYLKRAVLPLLPGRLRRIAVG